MSRFVAPLPTVPHGRTGQRSRRQWYVMGLILVVVLGCAEKQDGDQSASPNAGERLSASINGLDVLGDMLVSAGNTVSDRAALSPVLKDSADVIIWAPDDFNVPDPETCDQINKWLQAKANRAFVYIGRDFDARVPYWRDIAAQAPPTSKARYVRRQVAAEARFLAQRASRPVAANCDWFSIDGSSAPREIDALGGPWASGIDVAKSEIELNSTLIPHDTDEQLLQDGDGNMLAARQKVDCTNTKLSWLPSLFSSNLILIANGSFLFNEPLVNHEHRKLAARLIDMIGRDKQVVILDSQNHEPFADRDPDSPEQSPQSMIDIFNVWPLNAVLVQFGILIVLVCFSKWPIFGPPRDPPAPAISDFGRHVDALGAAMAATGDAAYAQSRVEQYRQMRDTAGPRAINRTNVKKQN